MAEFASDGAKKIIDKSKEKVDVVTLQKRIAKAQQKLGMLVYASVKSGVENTELVNKYVNEIDQLQKELEKLEPEVEKEELNIFVMQQEKKLKENFFVAASSNNFPQNHTSVFIKK